MKDLIQIVRASIERHHLLPRGSIIVAGVSGGPDSLCLLHLLRALAPEYGISIHVAHLNHQLRNVDADEDAEFVARIAAEWGLPFTGESRDIAAYARSQRLAIEEAARQMRYSFLAEVAQHLGSDTVAVAHNADDQAESVLMHLMRGSGIAGMRGMLPRSNLLEMKLAPAPGPNSRPLALVRPLLSVTRQAIEAYCAEHDLEPRFDVSNLDQTYFRNWLRHTVLPLLAQHNPGVREVLGRTAEVAAADYALLHAEMERAMAGVAHESSGAIVFNLAAWQTLPLALKRATIREAIHRLRRNLRNINFVHVERGVDVAERGTTGDIATLAEGLYLWVSYDSFVVQEEGHESPLPDWPLLSPGARVEVSIPGVTALPGSDWSLEAAVVTEAPFRDNRDPWTAYLDADVCSGRLVLRTREAGDRIAPQGMGGRTQKLSETMINLKVPRAARDRMPVLVCESAERIVWACGLRVDERAAVTGTTRRILHLRFRPD